MEAPAFAALLVGLAREGGSTAVVMGLSFSSPVKHTREPKQRKACCCQGCHLLSSACHAPVGGPAPRCLGCSRAGLGDQRPGLAVCRGHCSRPPGASHWVPAAALTPPPLF